ncbi:MAG TPA: biotin--[acetyl-CoA-carboxylase] ligase [Balneolaceae bacterium]|nr:biotin--[acetyl-CoA-carboxylase] ligase [Balneolaceae bacterium]
MNSQFDMRSLDQKLSTQWLGRNACYFEELGSTNTYAKKMPSEEVKHGLLCLADNQTNGRGQYDRKWESEIGKNLTFSLAFRPQTSERFHVLTLACALALVEYLNHCLQQKKCAYIKWPNDVMLNGKKVAGFLTETVFSGNKLDRLVIGIGFNVNQKEFPDKIADKSTSVYLEKGETLVREEVLSELLSRIEYKYNLWHRRQSGLIKAINRNIEGYGQWINLVVDNNQLEDPYKLLGIDETGKLLVLDDDGGIQSFSYEQIRLIID